MRQPATSVVSSAIANSTSYKKITILHIAQKQLSPAIWTNAFKEALADLGTITVIENGSELSECEVASHIRQHQVLLTGWDSLPVPDTILGDSGALEYICHITGSVKQTLSEKFFNASIPITNWGNSMSFEVAEGALTLLLACLKNLRGQIEEKRSGIWSDNFNGPALLGGSLRNLRIGLYGFGTIGQRFAQMLQPFGAKLTVYDPYVTQFPDYITPVESLERLFSPADAISIHAGVTPDTINSVTADLLSKLPTHSIIINTARGEIIDQEALFEELKIGRLRAGLDVLNDPEKGDHLPADHPARQWPNLILSAHAISINHWPFPMCSPDCPLQVFHETALSNLRRFMQGRSLKHKITKEIFHRMT
ncbi:NAD(P)-dependent oxidoreductase [Coraliomargarita algicola]|uniref:NAD(P)-dependent oxidoreductase n=1 Tax=Coraliomargarita algicola TaxID=3092156 RepID=A0ABZ0RIQ7_9BACT|nr:NAD(P)-dependent oxidoreductase [Coraliomargarita sp. J2-16]WPJ96086.1 NAD(P)-dependent oxidoreductase [Coraliomargarita sp. J2-16]